MSDAQLVPSAFFNPTANGRSELTRSVDAVIASLSSIGKGPRTPLLPAQLRSLVTAIEVCPDDGVPFEEVATTFGEVVWANGVIPTDPACCAHLHPPTLLASVATEVAVSATNQSMDSWDQSPVATEVELHLCDFLAKRLGFSSTGSGVMTSGGTASNVLGLTLARAKAAHAIGVDVGADGLPLEAKTWRILSSDQAHFSVQRAAAQLGLGRRAVESIPTLRDGTMDLDALDAYLVRPGRRTLAPLIHFVALQREQKLLVHGSTSMQQWLDPSSCPTPWPAHLMEFHWPIQSRLTSTNCGGNP